MKDKNNTHLVEKKIQYFRDYWGNLDDHYSIENQLTHVIVYDPKEFFKEFLYEIKLNGLSKKRNRVFFFKKTKQFSELNLDFLKPTLTLIKQQFNEKNYDYLSHLISKIIIDLSNFKLGNEIITKLTAILTDNSDIDKNRIKDFTNLILVELMYKKYSKKTISKIIDNIFASYTERDNKISCDFPHNIPIKHRSDLKSDKFKNKLKACIDSLTIEDRLLTLKTYLNKKPEKLKYIFQIQGLKGDDANIKIGNVQIYNPKTIKLIKEPDDRLGSLSDEMFGVTDNDFICCNGAVEVDIIDTEYDRQEALQALDKVMDVVASLYSYYKTPIVINKFKHLVVNGSGKNVGAGRENDIQLPSIEIENEKYKHIEKFYSNKILQKNTLSVDANIINSIYWKRKAIESIDDNQKILFQWIALENILDNATNIFSVVPKLLARKELYKFAWSHFERLRNIAGTNHNFFLHRTVNLPPELINSIGLNANKAHIKHFIDNIDKINEYMDKNSLFYDELNYLKNIFTDTDKCIELLNSFEQNISEKLIYVYRIRNKIAHNANNEITPLIATYADFIAEVSAISIAEIVSKRDRLKLDTTTKIVNDVIYEYEKFKIKLQEEGTNILLDN